MGSGSSRPALPIGLPPENIAAPEKDKLVPETSVSKEPEIPMEPKIIVGGKRKTSKRRKKTLKKKHKRKNTKKKGK